MIEQSGTAWKILAADELAVLERDGRFEGSADDARDGYVHLCTTAQLETTLAKHFAGRTDLQLAAVDLGAFGDSLKWEAGFPHLYGPLLLETVVAYGPVERHADGSLKLPVTG